MPQVSRIKLDKKAEDKILKTLELVLTKLNKEEEMKRVLPLLLTSTERLMIAKRLSILILLKEEFSDSKISQVLNVTRITVAKMRLYLELKEEEFKPVFRILNKEKTIKELKTILLKLTSYSIRASSGYVK